jgi:hypothetical protein
MPAIFTISATVCFAAAVLHTFMVSFFTEISTRYKKGSLAAVLFHYLGEAELVFAIWAAIWLIFVGALNGFPVAWEHLRSLSFTEPAFVFVTLTLCSSSPILNLAASGIHKIAALLPLPEPTAFFLVALVVGPLLGSLITEPAAMTVTALILLERFFSKPLTDSLKYATLGLLFVNVSVGGTLTHFAAPPVLMVASRWDWDLSHMLLHFGWKAALSSTLSTALFAYIFRNELRALSWPKETKVESIPLWLSLLHVTLLFLVVLAAHRPVYFAAVFAIFLFVFRMTKRYQAPLKIKEAVGVALFLAGLVILGKPQRWWVEPVLTQLDSLSLYFGAMGLTAFTDNAAITYLGAQVPDLSIASRYALVAGAVVGGGLTVIANAPNPAGYAILNSRFGARGIEAFKLFKAALLPTAVAAVCFWL